MNKKELVKSEATLYSVILELEYAVAVNEETIEEFQEEIKGLKKFARKHKSRLAKAKTQYKEITGREYKHTR